MSKKSAQKNVSKHTKNLNHLRVFENQKTEVKYRAIEAWRNGKKITEISRDLNRSRATIYSWLKAADEALSRPSTRSRLQIDSLTKSRVLELYVLFERPSCRDLSLALQILFSINLSASQVRRYLKRWQFDHFQPSSFFSSLKRARSLEEILDNFHGTLKDKESAQEWLERFEHQFSSNRPNEVVGASEEDL